MSTFISKIAAQKLLKVCDAKSVLNFTLTQKDIDKGVPKDPCNCAFANAIKRAFKEEVNAVWFFRSTAWVETDTRMIRFALTDAVQREIVAFDRGGRLEPGAFRCKPPSISLAAARAQYAKRPKQRSRKPREGGAAHVRGIRTLKLPNGVELSP